MTSTIDDVITAEVIRGALLVAAEEASIVVVRAAHSTFIQEGADACAAILDADANSSRCRPPPASCTPRACGARSRR